MSSSFHRKPVNIDGSSESSSDVDRSYSENSSTPTPQKSNFVPTKLTDSRKKLTPQDILALQKTVGNKAVIRILRESRDQQMATQGDRDRELQRKAPANHSEGKQPTRNHPVLPEVLQTKMESAFESDFSDVAIKRDSASAAEIKAKAYTEGNVIHFAPRQYDPDSATGQELIGHELAHVVQQRQGRVAETVRLGSGLAVNDNEELEKEAEVEGRRAAQGEKANIAGANYSTPITNRVIQGAFTVNAFITGDDEKNFDPNKLEIEKLNMSEKKRPETKYGGSKQNRHTVAWQAKVLLWKGMFNGDFKAVLERLEKEAEEDKANDKEEKNKDLRETLGKKIQELKNATNKSNENNDKMEVDEVKAKESDLSFSEINQLLSEAITTYIEAYQKASFTTFKQGKAIGHAEAQRIKKLSEWQNSLKSLKESGNTAELGDLTWTTGKGKTKTVMEATTKKEEKSKLIFEVAWGLLDLPPDNTNIQKDIYYILVKQWLKVVRSLYYNFFHNNYLYLPNEAQMKNLKTVTGSGDVRTIVEGAMVPKEGEKRLKNPLDDKYENYDLPEEEADKIEEDEEENEEEDTKIEENDKDKTKEGGDKDEDKDKDKTKEGEDKDEDKDKMEGVEGTKSSDGEYVAGKKEELSAKEKKELEEEEAEEEAEKQLGLRPFVVNLEMKYKGEKKQNYKAKTLKIKEIQISDERPPTAHKGGKQMSHTIPWSMDRLVWQKEFGSNQTISEVLIKLVELLSEEKDAEKNKLNTEARENLRKEVNDVTTKEKTIYEWTKFINTKIQEYVKLYQLSSFTTFFEMKDDGTDRPGSRGEGRALKGLMDLEKVLGAYTGKWTPTEFARIWVKYYAGMLIDLPGTKENRKKVDTVWLKKRWLSDMTTIFPNIVSYFVEDLKVEFDNVFILARTKKIMDQEKYDEEKAQALKQAREKAEKEGNSPPERKNPPRTNLKKQNKTNNMEGMLKKQEEEKKKVSDKDRGKLITDKRGIKTEKEKAEEEKALNKKKKLEIDKLLLDSDGKLELLLGVESVKDKTKEVEMEETMEKDEEGEEGEEMDKE